LIYYLNDVANNKYTFPAFTITAPASVTYCPIIDYDIVPDVGSTGTISRDTTCTAGSPCTTQNFIVDLTDKRRNVDSDPILFNIVATATGGIQLTSSLISLEVHCPNSVTENAIASPITQTQDAQNRAN
jgi:hypothetical protein